MVKLINDKNIYIAAFIEGVCSFTSKNCIENRYTHMVIW